MKVAAGLVGEGLEKLFDQSDAEVADHRLLVVDLINERLPVREVERDARQRLIHRQQKETIPPDPPLFAEGFLERLPEHDAGILDGVVIIDIDIPDRIHL